VHVSVLDLDTWTLHFLGYIACVLWWYSWKIAELALNNNHSLRPKLKYCLFAVSRPTPKILLPFLRLKSTIYHTQTSTWTITPPMWLPLIELQIWQKCQSDFALISNVVVDQFRLNYKLNNRTRGPPGYHYMKIICLKLKN
jgi:hypothetical protein